MSTQEYLNKIKSADTLDELSAVMMCAVEDGDIGREELKVLEPHFEKRRDSLIREEWV